MLVEDWTNLRAGTRRSGRDPPSSAGWRRGAELAAETASGLDDEARRHLFGGEPDEAPPA